MQYFTKRPFTVSLAVILGSIGVLIVFATTILSFITLGNQPDIAIAGLSILIFALFQLYILMGLWHMKKIALITYTVLFVAMLLLGVNRWYALIIPIVVLIFGYNHYREMK